MSSFMYPLRRIDGELIFYFVSLNDQGSNPIFKIITYKPVDKYGIRYYNLGFGDYNKDTGLPDDRVTSNNGDMRKILETVVSTLKFFFQEHPDKLFISMAAIKRGGITIINLLTITGTGFKNFILFKDAIGE